MSSHLLHAKLRGMRFRPVLFGVMVTVTCGGFFACGSRTALPGDFDAVTSGNDDSGTDARKIRDTGPDTTPPPIDARPPVDASRLDCPDASATLIYVVTTANELLSFYPPSASFTLIGNIACPDTNMVGGAAATPFSMAVDRRGTAYVEFNDGNLFKVDTATAACAATPFVADQSGFTNFGMGFATIGGGPAEQLFIAGDVDPNTGVGLPDLGSIDVTTFLVSDIGNLPLDNAELTGTGDGRLFGFWTDTDTDVTSISEIDKTSGNIVGSDVLPGVTVGMAWAFGYWGGNFYTFTEQPSQPSAVTEFNPITKSVNVISGYPNPIVGAGVSTCAPQ